MNVASYGTVQYTPLCLLPVFYQHYSSTSTSTSYRINQHGAVPIDITTICSVTYYSRFVVVDDCMSCC
jgi:hypothetical protein